jgi:hypothetical protein
MPKTLRGSINYRLPEPSTLRVAEDPEVFRRKKLNLIKNRREQIAEIKCQAISHLGGACSGCGGFFQHYAMMVQRGGQVMKFGGLFKRSYVELVEHLAGHTLLCANCFLQRQWRQAQKRLP